jgi:cardiolipin synthase (CMP-forming)
VLNVPNAITMLRFALVPVISVQVLQRDYGVAIVLLMVSAVSDLADGMIARHWDCRTRFGAIADPLADKLTTLAVTILLTFQHALPWLFALAVILRDALIVGGALAYHLLIGPMQMAPSRISKLNTGLEIMLLLAMLAIRGGLVPDGDWRRALLGATFVTIVLSGGHYVLVWGRNATRARQVLDKERAPSGRNRR